MWIKNYYRGGHHLNLTSVGSNLAIPQALFHQSSAALKRTILTFQLDADCPYLVTSESLIATRRHPSHSPINPIAFLPLSLRPLPESPIPRIRQIRWRVIETPNTPRTIARWQWKRKQESNGWDCDTWLCLRRREERRRQGYGAWRKGGMELAHTNYKEEWGGMKGVGGSVMWKRETERGGREKYYRYYWYNVTRRGFLSDNYYDVAATWQCSNTIPCSYASNYEHIVIEQ